MGATGVFLIQGDRQLVELYGEPYASEADLQDLLARYPNLIPAGQSDGSAPRAPGLAPQTEERRWLLVKREAAIPAEEDGAGRWAVDHLFLDRDAVPTLIEVKRSTDTRIRREVVGQMLDYAANCVVHWPAEFIRAQFEANCGDRDPEQELLAFLGDGGDAETFWQSARTNLQAGRIRLIFVADEIPVELRRVVEFLNEQMNPAEVLAVEIRQFCGQGLRTLVPRVVGQTARKSGPVRQTRQWDEESFFRDLADRRGSGPAAAARAILSWAKERGLRVWWGKGKTDGSFFPMLDCHNKPHHLIAVWSSGSVETQFQSMQSQPPFDQEARRLELLRRLNAIPGVTLPEDGLRRRPTFPLGVLENEAALAQLLETLDWAIREIRSTPAGSEIPPERAPGSPAPDPTLG